MGEFLKSLIQIPRGLRYKVLIAFCLMSLIPLLICVYLTNLYIFPYITTIGQVSLVILIDILVALLGLKLSMDLVKPIIRIALQARKFVEGEFKEIEVEKTSDEVEELGRSLNEMNRRLRESMDQLKDYGERTKEINLEVNKNVTALANLLQIGNLISSGMGLKEALDSIVEKIAQIHEGTKTFLMLMDAPTKKLVTCATHEIADTSSLFHAQLDLIQGILGHSVLEKRGFKVDEKHRANQKEVIDLLKDWAVTNAIVSPIVIRGVGIGVIGVGNNLENFHFSEGDEEIYRVFARQVAIAFENDRLTQKTKELEIKDELTGLFNKQYIEQRLDEEIKRVIYSQRPCAFVLFDVDGFRELAISNGILSVEGGFKKIAGILVSEITEIDKAGRYGDDEFALLLPEKNKKEAMEIAERVRKRVEDLQLFGGQGRGALTLSGGVSENPIDGSASQELIAKAKVFLQFSKVHGKNRVTGMIPQGVRT